MITTNAKEIASFLEKVSDVRLEAWIRAAMGKEADSYADYVKECWLSGDPVRMITGELRGSVAPYTPKKRVPGEVSVTVTKGVNVWGMLNYVAKWNGTSKEFMKPSWLRWQGEKRMGYAIDRVVQEQLSKA